MRRTLAQTFLPHPLLTLLLTLVWALLHNSYTSGTIAFGLLLGVGIPILTAAYWPDRPKLARPLKMFAYMLIVMWDIIIANVQVAMIVLFKQRYERRLKEIFE